jgi:hypothetical protein
VTRLLLCALLGSLLAACAQPQAQGCDITVTRELAFSNPDAPDTVTARAIGATCDKATGLYIVHDAEARPIWAWAAPLPRAFGDVFPADDPEHMREFLQSWTQPALLTTQQAPPWADLARDQTTIDQFTYEDIRARDLPMLCHFSGTARQVCVFWEPAAGAAGHFLERDVEELEE